MVDVIEEYDLLIVCDLAEVYGCQVVIVYVENTVTHKLGGEGMSMEDHHIARNPKNVPDLNATLNTPFDMDRNPFPSPSPNLPFSIVESYHGDGSMHIVSSCLPTTCDEVNNVASMVEVDPKRDNSYVLDEDDYKRNEQSTDKEVSEDGDIQTSYDDFAVGQVFTDKKKFVQVLQEHAMFQNYEFVTVKIKRNRVDARSMVRTCRWRIYAYMWSPPSKLWASQCQELIHSLVDTGALTYTSKLHSR